MHTKYEGCTSYTFKGVANVKVFRTTKTEAGVTTLFHIFSSKKRTLDEEWSIPFGVGEGFNPTNTERLYLDEDLGLFFHQNDWWSGGIEPATTGLLV